MHTEFRCRTSTWECLDCSPAKFTSTSVDLFQMFHSAGSQEASPINEGSICCQHWPEGRVFLGFFFLIDRSCRETTTFRPLQLLHPGFGNTAALSQISSHFHNILKDHCWSNVIVRNTHIFCLSSNQQTTAQLENPLLMSYHLRWAILVLC